MLGDHSGLGGCHSRILGSMDGNTGRSEGATAEKAVPFPCAVLDPNLRSLNCALASPKQGLVAHLIWLIPLAAHIPGHLQLRGAVLPVRQAPGHEMKITRELPILLRPKSLIAPNPVLRGQAARTVYGPMMLLCGDATRQVLLPKSPLR
jgi:hypothetical protein